ncbi:MAG: hypothetical protein KIT73_06245 [Burkholderiales bacterium]|nr:hypothetical protein [Burkholderiales bacterium]
MSKNGLSLLLFGIITSIVNGPVTAHDDAPDVPSMSARYRLEVTDEECRTRQGPEWWLIRESSRVVTAIPALDQAEVWTRDADTGEVTLERLFHAQRRVIEYTPGELRTRNAEPDWHALGSVLDPDSLKTLEATGTGEWRGRPVTMYRGTIGGERIEVDWLSVERLPLRVDRSTRRSRSVLTLLALDPSTQRASDEVQRVTPLYIRLDSADFGDMESDPFVQAVEALDGRNRRWAHGGGHVHAHAAH